MSGEVMIRPDAKSIGLSGYGGRKKQSLLTAARHNLRDIQKELGADSHIDAGRICLNEILAGPCTPAGVNERALALMAGIGYKPKRKDFTQAHELLFTLASKTQLDTRAFFRFCLDFVVAEFGLESILSAVVHHDESAPHLHILLIPIAGGEYVGSSLITKPSLAELIEKFRVSAFKAFRVRVEKPLTGPMRAQVAQTVHEGLKTILGPHIHSAVLDAILKAAGRNPASFMAALNIAMPELNDGGAEFRRIALSTGKGAKTERAWKPYGFESGHGGDRENLDPTPCVVSAKESPSLLPPLPPQPAPVRPPPAAPPLARRPAIELLKPQIEEEVRDRDEDRDPALYDFVKGEWLPQPVRPERRQQQAARAWVATACAAAARP
jgi:hypothetical protein